jgi:integrase
VCAEWFTAKTRDLGQGWRIVPTRPPGFVLSDPEFQQLSDADRREVLMRGGLVSILDSLQVPKDLKARVIDEFFHATSVSDLRLRMARLNLPTRVRAALLDLRCSDPYADLSDRELAARIRAKYERELRDGFEAWQQLQGRRNRSFIYLYFDSLRLSWIKSRPRKDVGRALSAEEEERLLKAAGADSSPNRNPMLYTFVRTALATGMRSGEIISMMWSQIDLVNNIITVGRAKTSSGTGRQIPMNATLQAVIETHASWYLNRFKAVRPEWYLFPGRVGKPQAGSARPLDPARPTTTIKTSWETLRVKANVQCRLHDLRHTAATKMAEAGVPESTMLAIMGHMSRAMLERYSHIRMAAKRTAVQALEPRQKAADSNGVSTISTTISGPATIN